MEWYTETLVIIIVFVICDDDRNFSDWFCIFLLAIDVYVFGTLVWIRLRDKSNIQQQQACHVHDTFVPTGVFKCIYVCLFVWKWTIVWKCQRDNQKRNIKEGQTIKWPNEKGQTKLKKNTQKTDIERHEPTNNLRWNQVLWKGQQFLLH
jgi:hypothetical protein